MAERRTDEIREIRISASGGLIVTPQGAEFPYIYREAKGVKWDPEKRALVAPKPKEWRHEDWFRRIVAAARERGTQLLISPSTQWANVTAELKAAAAAQAQREGETDQYQGQEVSEELDGVKKHVELLLWVAEAVPVEA